MCRWLAYSGTETYLEDLLYKPEHSLIDQSLNAHEAKTITNGDGFGIGWYGSRAQPGLYHDILPAWNDGNLQSLAHQVASRMFFAHIRASTGTETSRANCHPFRYKSWLFMHNGQIGGYSNIRRPIENLIPDDLYHHRNGTTDSEALFLILLANGLREDPAHAMAKTIKAIRDIMHHYEIKTALRITASFTNGEDLWAVRYSSDDKPPTLYSWEDDNSLIILSEPLDDTSGWKAIEENVILHGVHGKIKSERTLNVN